MRFRKEAKQIMRRLFPKNNHILYKIGKTIVDYYNGDNNDDMASNGELWLLHKALPAASVIFDVGANAGKWTSNALQINSKATIHCFEPGTDNYNLLLKNKFPGNVILNKIGLGAKEDKKELFISEVDCGKNSFYNRNADKLAPINMENVIINTIDNYCEQAKIGQIDFIKIDAEGSELAVLKGARRILAKGAVVAVQFEYGGTYIDARILLKDIWEFMNCTNPSYSFYKIYPDRLRLMPHYEQSLETFQYSNWVITNRKLV